MMTSSSTRKHAGAGPRSSRHPALRPHRRFPENCRTSLVAISESKSTRQSKQGSRDDPKPQTLAVCWWPIHAEMVAQDVFLSLGFLLAPCFMPVVIHDFKMVGANLFTLGQSCQSPAFARSKLKMCRA